MADKKKAAQPTVPQSVLDYFDKGFSSYDQTGMTSLYLDPNNPASGTAWQQVADRSPGQDGGPFATSEYMGYTPRVNNDGKLTTGVGDPYSRFDPTGKYTGQGAFKDAGSGLDLAAAGIIAALTMGAGGALLGAAGGATNGGLLGAAGSNFVTGAAGMGAGAGSVGSGAGFIGEGALSGIGAWDGALASAPAWSAGGTAAAGAGAASGGGSSGGGAASGAVKGAASAGGDAAGGALGGVKAGGGLFDSLSGIGSYLGPAATVLGGLAGAQGNEQSTSTTRELPGYLQGPVAGQGGLISQTQGLLNSQLPQTTAQGQAMTNYGNGLLSRPIAGNGVGQVTLNSPTTATNPYATGILDDLQRRQGDLIQQGLLGAQGSAIGAGGLGGTRQALAESKAITTGADNFTGQAANFMGGLYNADQNRALQQYGQDQAFYGQQRGQDQAGVSLGADLVKQGTALPWIAPTAAAGIYGTFGNQGTTTNNSQSGGGWQGLLGGALAGGSLAKQAGWW